MKAELYEFLLENKYCHGIMFKKSMETFVEHYNMVGLVEEESLMRAFQRWRKMVKEGHEGFMRIGGDVKYRNSTTL